MSVEQTSRVLTQLTGKTIVGVRRIHYVRPDGSHGDVGPFEVTFAGGPTILMNVGSDGETLTASDGPWMDPFGGPLSPESSEYLRQVGKWASFDVATTAPYSSLVGQRVVSVDPAFDEAGKLRAATFRVGPCKLVVSAAADELLVSMAEREA